MKKLILLFNSILTFLALLSSCSSIDPDVDFKGKIDDDLLISISRCKVPMTLDPDYKKSYVYVRSSDGGEPTGKWKVYGASEEPPVHIFNGSSWVYYGKMPWNSNEYVFEGAVEWAWDNYKSRTRYNKIQMRKCPFEYDPQTKRILFDDRWWDVESASKDKIVISFVFRNVDQPHTVNTVSKCVYTYYIKPLSYDPESVDTYESVVDVMLAHIRILKEYKGDIWTVNYNDSKFNLAKLEEVLLSGKTKYEDIDADIYNEIVNPN